MGEISSNLKEFKRSVEPQLRSMYRCCDVLKEKISTAMKTTTSIKSGIDSSYNSSNKSSIIGSIESMNSIYSKMNTSIDSDLRRLIDESKALIDLITELENINKEIDEQNAIVNANQGKEEGRDIANEARRQINNNNSKFYNTHIIAMNKLNSLMSMDKSFTFTEEFSINNNNELPETKDGTLVLKSFTASNNIVVDYYIWVPKYENGVNKSSNLQVEKSPALLYMHGGSRYQDVSSDYAITYGLGKLIAEKILTPPGIVIIPVMRNFDENGIRAVKEMTDNVVAEYNIDTDRIAVSGHSYGGATAYKLINRYPNYFSCCVPISGAESVTKAFSNMRVWSINGSEEMGTSSTDIPFSKERMNYIKSYGGDAFMTIINGDHRTTNKEAFEREYKSPDGEVINPLIWAFKQVKGDKKA